MFGLMYEYNFAHTGLSHEVFKNDENPFKMFIKEWVQALGPALNESCYNNFWIKTKLLIY